jgi:hypothetical protein
MIPTNAGERLFCIGDFRLTLEETKRLRPLHCGGSLLEISTLYVDTTFCHPIGTEIPSRDTSRDIILKLIERWLAKDPTNVVHLQCACFGYEHIFMGIHKKFKTKIHIAPWKMNAYREISAVTDCLTTNGDSTNIHTCTYQKGQNEKKESSGLPCGSCQRNGAPPNVLRIKPSTQWFLFNKKSTTHPCVFLPQSNKFRVIHSMHASFRELRDFITYVRPRRIVPCVIPFGDASLSDVCARYVCTRNFVKPLNKGHLGDIESFFYSEVSLIRRFNFRAKSLEVLIRRVL